MPVNIEKIKDALDKFEADDFISAKEILQQEIHQAKDAYLKNKLELDKNVDEVCGSKKKTKKVIKEDTQKE